MRTERQEEKLQVKACPYWARYAEGPSGWTIAYCSYEACKEQEKLQRAWEGPFKATNCLLGFSVDDAEQRPTIILWNPTTRMCYGLPITKSVSDHVWNQITDAFYLHVGELKYVSMHTFQKSALFKEIVNALDGLGEGKSSLAIGQ